MSAARLVSPTRLLAVVAVATALFAVAGTATASAAPFAFQPIDVQRIALPDAVTSAGWPVFAKDGKHVLFFSTGPAGNGATTGSGTTAELWITDLHGKGARCLSCGLAHGPSSQGEGEVTPFPDGKRVFFGSFYQPGAGSYGVLECAPSVADCRRASVLPVDFSAAEPGTIPLGGVASTPQVNLKGAFAAKLAPDGRHIGFSDIRTDSVQMMVVGRIARRASGYVVTDPKVINPAAPTSLADTSVTRWSDGGPLYEFKTFTNGGADVTYLQTGGPDTNPDVWSVNLATGKRTRLTHHPDHDEDNALSPDGRLMALWSYRTMHVSDWIGGLLPVRDFIFAPATLLTLGITLSNKRCHGPMWILPATGDDGGRIAGQPIVYDRDPDVFVTNNLTGWPQWSPDGTMLGLNTVDLRDRRGSYPAHAPYLLVARFPGRRAAKARKTKSSAPGPWAVSPTEYHPTYGFGGLRTFRGAGGGTVVVDYGTGAEPGAALGQNRWTETYSRYSEVGKSFVTGKVTIDAAGPFDGTYTADLTMTGAHRGSTHVRYDTATGDAHGTSTLDGHTISGPSAEQAAKGACPAQYPERPKLDVAAKKVGSRTYRITVTSTIASVGGNEGERDTRRVAHASVTLGRRRTRTDASGVARVTVRGSRRLTVAAGDTLEPARLVLAR